jgi:8-oxo-dGTP pyrophosphatase MutT (NUDIX family)
VEAREAATVLLLRDAPRLEVFMLRRNPRSGFVAGAYVFPGGAVDDDDTDAAPAGLVQGVDEAEALRWLGPESGPGALRYWVAAIRETFEEAGVLLARDAAAGDLVDTDSEGFAEEFERERRALIAGDRSFLDVVRDHGLVLDAGALVPISRWVTPMPAPRRYDTWFFVAHAPSGHAYRHDDDEAVHSEWIEPAVALERARSGAIELVHPTFRSLQVVNCFESANDVVEASRAAWRIEERPTRALDAGIQWELPLSGADLGAEDLVDGLLNSTSRLGRRFAGEATG